MDYPTLAVTATRLIGQNGFAAKLRRIQQPNYLASQGIAVSAGTIDLPTVAIWKSRTKFFETVGRGVGGVPKVDNILRQERAVVIDGSQEPQLPDLLVISATGEVWQILDIEAKNPGGIAIAYILTVRR